MKKVVKITAPKEVADAYKIIKEQVDYPKLMHDKWAFEWFLQSGESIDSKLQIETYSSKGYVKRDGSITVYVNEQLLQKLEERAEVLGVKRNTVMIQAIKNYCTIKEKEIGQEFMWSF